MGECDWKAIQQIRSSLSIPVYANGGIACLSDVERCIKETGVDGVMVGEAILENPALFVNGIDPTDGHNLTVVRMSFDSLYRMRFATSIWISKRSIQPSLLRSRLICSNYCIVLSVYVLMWDSTVDIHRRTNSVSYDEFQLS